MREISKGPEPSSLIAHRKTPDSDYENYKAKEDLRHALVQEQRGLCCYCMARIRPERASMKIEHWKCQRNYSREQLNYRNLLGACLGGEGHPGHLQHCDTRKGDSDLDWNPADPSHHIETRLWYGPDGSVHAHERNFDDQLNLVLNLNLPLLKSRRKAIYDGFLQWWKGEKGRSRGRVPRERLERERARHNKGLGELAPYIPIAVWLLSQKLAKVAG